MIRVSRIRPSASSSSLRKITSGAFVLLFRCIVHSLSHRIPSIAVGPGIRGFESAMACGAASRSRSVETDCTTIANAQVASRAPGAKHGSHWLAVSRSLSLPSADIVRTTRLPLGSLWTPASSARCGVTAFAASCIRVITSFAVARRTSCFWSTRSMEMVNSNWRVCSAGVGAVSGCAESRLSGVRGWRASACSIPSAMSFGMASTLACRVDIDSAWGALLVCVDIVASP